MLEREELVELLDRALALLPAATRTRWSRTTSRSSATRRSPNGSAPRPTRCRCGSAAAGRGCGTCWRRRSPTTPSPRDGPAATTPAGTRPGCAARSADAAVCDAPRRGRGRLPLRVLRPRGMSARLPLDAPAFGSLVGGVRRPSAIRRASPRGPTSTGTRPARRACAATARCGPALRAGGRRALVQPPRLVRRLRRVRRGVSGSLSGLALAMPEVRAALKRDPGCGCCRCATSSATEPTRRSSDSERDREPVVSAVFLADSLRLVHVG